MVLIWVISHFYPRILPIIETGTVNYYKVPYSVLSITHMAGTHFSLSLYRCEIIGFMFPWCYQIWVIPHFYPSILPIIEIGTVNYYKVPYSMLSITHMAGTHFSLSLYRFEIIGFMFPWCYQIWVIPHIYPSILPIIEIGTVNYYKVPYSMLMWRPITEISFESFCFRFTK